MFENKRNSAGCDSYGKYEFLKHLQEMDIPFNKIDLQNMES